MKELKKLKQEMALLQGRLEEQQKQLEEKEKEKMN